MLIKKLVSRVYRNDDPTDGGGGSAVAEDGEVIGTGNDARLAFMNQINDANDGIRAEELAEINDDGTTSQFQIDATTQAEFDRFDAEANGESTPPADTTPADAQAAALHRIKVNGRELELSTEELIARAQKVEAADQYIADAARIRREAEALAQQQHTQQQAVTPRGPTPAELLEERRALVRAIQMGTEEEAMNALEKLQQPSRPALSADDLARTVDERLTFKDAVSKFETTYSDITGDPMLLQLALQKDQQLLAAGDKRGYWDRYNEIGTELRNWKQSLVPKTDPAVAAQAAADQAAISKTQRKAAAASTPNTASARAPAVKTEDEGEDSVSDVIASIAKARGGPQWMRT
jgi:hypothetical protein